MTGGGPGGGDPVVLAARFQRLADPGRLADHVAWLARSPRGRRHHPQAMAEAEEYVTSHLAEAGWTVTRAPFERRWMPGVTDRGGPPSVILRRRLHARVRGVNLLAQLPAAPPAPHVVIIAHLDSVACSPGADDNASGVAALLECGRLLASLPSPPAVSLAVTDMEELGKAGSRALASDRGYRRATRAVICLESVGVYMDEPGTQRVGALGLIFRDVGQRIRERECRGDFALALCRTSSRAAAMALADAAAALDAPLPVLVARDPRPDGWRGQLLTRAAPMLGTLDRSDHAPFWQRGVPAMMITTTALFRNAHYHQPGDLPERLDYPRITALAVAVAATAASWPTARNPHSPLAARRHR